MNREQLEEKDLKIIQPGDLYWKTTDGISHPHVIIQVVESGNGYLSCVVSTNLKRINLPGNVLLESGEANLSKQSIVLVSRTVVVQPEELGEYIGSLSEERLQEVMVGMEFVTWLTRQTGQE